MVEHAEGSQFNPPQLQVKLEHLTPSHLSYPSHPVKSLVELESLLTILCHFDWPNTDIAMLWILQYFTVCFRLAKLIFVT